MSEMDPGRKGGRVPLVPHLYVLNETGWCGGIVYGVIGSLFENNLHV